MTDQSIDDNLRTLLAPGRRLQPDQLPQPLRGYSWRVIAVGLIACLIIGLTGLGLYPAGLVIELPEDFNLMEGTLSVPFSLIIIVLIGLGVAFGALVYGSFESGWRWPRLTRLATGLLALALPLTFLDYARILAGGWSGTGLVQLALVAVAVICALGCLAGAMIARPGAARWLALLTTVSFVCVAGAFLVYRLTWGDFNAANPSSEAVLLPVTAVVGFLTPLVWLVDAIFFWQAITEAKLFSRELGTNAADLTSRLPWLLAVALAAKLLFLAAGYWRGGESWQRSLQDGLLAWLLAGIWAAAAGWWLVWRRRPVAMPPLNRSAVFLAVGFMLPFIIAFVLFLPVSALVGAGLDQIGFGLGAASVTLAGVGEAWTHVFMVALLPLGLVFLRVERWRSLAPVALLCSLWALPITIQLVLPSLNLSFAYLTFDALLTVVLLLAALYVWRRQPDQPDAWSLMLVLTVSTLIVLTDDLIPWSDTRLAFALLLILPLFYWLFFDASEMNAAARTRAYRVLRLLGLQAVLMLIVAWEFALGLWTPEQATFGAVAPQVMLPPLLALIIAGEISRRRPPAIIVANELA